MKRIGSAADLVDDLAERDEVAGPLRHLHRLAAAEEPDELAELHVEVAVAVGDRLHGRLHALDIAAVVGAPDVDHGRGSRAGTCRSDRRCRRRNRCSCRPTSSAAGRHRRRTAVARNSVCSRSSQSSGSWPFGGGSVPSIDEALAAQPVDRLGDRGRRRRAISERSEKKTSCAMSSASRSSRIIAIIASIAASRTSGSHSASCMPQAAGRRARGQRLADRLQVVAGIEPLRDRADRPRRAPRDSAG